MWNILSIGLVAQLFFHITIGVNSFQPTKLHFSTTPSSSSALPAGFGSPIINRKPANRVPENSQDLCACGSGSSYNSCCKVK